MLLMLLAGTTAKADPHAGRCHSRTLYEADSDTRICVTVGERIWLELPAVTGDGCSWSTTNTPNELELSWEHTEDPTDRRPGSPQLQVFEWVAVDTGSAELQLEYRRTRQPDAAPRRTFNLSVAVSFNSEE